MLSQTFIWSHLGTQLFDIFSCFPSSNNLFHEVFWDPKRKGMELRNHSLCPSIPWNVDRMVNILTLDRVKEERGNRYLSIGNVAKGPSTGTVPQRLLFETSLHNYEFKTKLIIIQSDKTFKEFPFYFSESNLQNFEVREAGELPWNWSC